MKKRVMLDLYLNELSNSELASLKELKKKAVDISKDEKSSASVHDCGHDDGTSCKNVVQL